MSNLKQKFLRWLFEKTRKDLDNLPVPFLIETRNEYETYSISVQTATSLTFEMWIKNWKPIHLCWLFYKMGWTIPKYLIGKTTTSTSSSSSKSTSSSSSSKSTSSSSSSHSTSSSSSVSTSSSSSSVSTSSSSSVSTSSSSSSVSTSSSSSSKSTSSSSSSVSTSSSSSSSSVSTTSSTTILPTVALNTPTYNATGVSVNPTLNFTGTAASGAQLEYNVQVLSNAKSFGWTSTANSSTNPGANNKLGSKFSLADNNAVLYQFAIKLRNVSGLSTAGRCAIYSDSGGTPDALLGQSSEVTIPNNTNGYVFFGLPTTVTINSGTYWLCFLVKDDNILDIWYTSGATNQGVTALDTYSDGFANPFGDTPTYDTNKYGIYANYYTVVIDKSSDTDPGFTGGHPYASGTPVDYTVQSADTLSGSTQYNWRARAKDLNGSGAYGDWPSTFLFTTQAVTTTSTSSSSSSVSTSSSSSSVSTTSSSSSVSTSSSSSSVSTSSSSSSLSTSSSSSSVSSSSSSSSVSSSSSSSTLLPTNKIYSREQSYVLGTTDADLSTAFSPQDYIDVSSDNAVYVDQSGTAGYEVFEFKNQNDNNTQPINARWEGQTNVAPSTSPVVLQIYNRTSGQWETLTTESTFPLANQDFSINGTQSANLTNYYDAQFWVAHRVYQLN